MSVHLATFEGKAKCGSRSYWGYGTYLEKLPSVPANCKRCLGTVVHRYETIEPPKEALGRILHYSWGYDMTFNEYAKIVKLNAKSAIAVPMKVMTNGGEHSHMGTGKARPIHEPNGEPFTVLFKKFKDGGHISIVGGKTTGGRSWSYWNGESNYENHWD